MKNYTRKKALSVFIALTLVSAISLGLVYMLFSAETGLARNAVAMSSGISARLEERGNGHRHYRPANNNRPLGRFPNMQPGDSIHKQPRVRRDDPDPASAIPAYVKVTMDIDITGLDPADVELIGKILGCYEDPSNPGTYIYKGIYDESPNWVFVPNDPPGTPESGYPLSGTFYYVDSSGVLLALDPSAATPPIFTHINVPSGVVGTDPLEFTVEDLDRFAVLGGKKDPGNIAEMIRMTLQAQLIQADNNPYKGTTDIPPFTLIPPPHALNSPEGYEYAFNHA